MTGGAGRPAFGRGARPRPHVFRLDADTRPFCECGLPRRNAVHVPPKDRTIPLF